MSKLTTSDYAAMVDYLNAFSASQRQALNASSSTLFFMGSQSVGSSSGCNHSSTQCPKCRKYYCPKCNKIVGNPDYYFATSMRQSLMWGSTLQGTGTSSTTRGQGILYDSSMCKPEYYDAAYDEKQQLVQDTFNMKLDLQNLKSKIYESREQPVLGKQKDIGL